MRFDQGSKGKQASCPGRGVPMTSPPMAGTTWASRRSFRSVSRCSMGWIDYDLYCGPSSRNLPPWYIVVTSSCAGNAEVSGNRWANFDELSFGL